MSKTSVQLSISPIPQIHPKRYCYTIRKTSASLSPLHEILLSQKNDKVYIPPKPFQVRQCHYSNRRVLVVLDWIFMKTNYVPRLAIQIETTQDKHTVYRITQPRYIYGKKTGFYWIYVHTTLEQIFPKHFLKFVQGSYKISIYLTQPGITWKIANW